MSLQASQWLESGVESGDLLADIIEGPMVNGTGNGKGKRERRIARIAIRKRMDIHDKSEERRGMREEERKKERAYQRT